MRNESPIGLATIAAFLPAAVAGVIFVVLLVRNGGDIDGATQATLAIIAALSSVTTGALRQWRAVNPPASGASPEDDEHIEGEVA